MPQLKDLFIFCIRNSLQARKIVGTFEMEEKQDIGGRRSKRLILKRNKENGVSNESSNHPSVEHINRGNLKI